MRETMTAKDWAPILTLALCVFVFNTSEYIPIGLLTSIGEDFSLTQAQTGRMVTIYAWLVAVLSLPLMLLAGKIQPKTLILGVVGLFAAAHALSAMAASWSILLISRALVAATHAVFWSVVTPFAMQIAAARYKTTALSLIGTGTALAMVFGIPIGRFFGLMLGWRYSFLVVGIISVLALVLLIVTFPKMENRNQISLKELPSLLSSPTLLGLFSLTAFLMTSNFTLYSYIEPFLLHTAEFQPESVTLSLALFGAVGMLTSVIFAKIYPLHPKAVLGTSLSGLLIVFFSLQLAATSAFCTVGLLILWALSITFFNLCLPAQIVQAAPYGTAVAMSVFSGLYNLGIGTGALIGSISVPLIGVEHLGYLAAVVAVPTIVVFFLKFLAKRH